MQEDNLIDDGDCNRSNDPKYKNRPAQQFLSSEVAEVIDWSSNSSDANPVENLFWKNEKQQISKNSTSFYS